jgi:hypothetical protein
MCGSALLCFLYSQISNVETPEHRQECLWYNAGSKADVAGLKAQCR